MQKKLAKKIKSGLFYGIYLKALIEKDQKYYGELHSTLSTLHSNCPADSQLKTTIQATMGSAAKTHPTLTSALVKQD